MTQGLKKNEEEKKCYRADYQSNSPVGLPRIANGALELLIGLFSTSLVYIVPT